jgi:phage baseplate assembly protein V
VLSPSGETASGIILTGIASAANPSPSHDKNKHVRRYPDGITAEVDHAVHRVSLTVPDDGAIVLSIGATTLTLTSAGVTLATPKFSGVQS